MKKNKVISIFIISVFYLAALVIGIFLFDLFPFSQEMPLLSLFIIDIIATVIVYIGSMCFHNSSVYDPYWSVAPMVLMVAFALIEHAVDAYSWILVALILAWGLRLTIHWAVHFKNLGEEDFRYSDIRVKHPKSYFIISFFGFHLMPTLLTFFGLFPAFYFIDKLVKGSLVPTAITVVAIVLAISAIVLEMIADIQMTKFKKKSYNTGLVNDEGLWQNSRHPNYLGEITFWFSLFVFSASLTVDAWPLIASPALIFLLFVFISCPMMDKNQLATKANYKEYYFHTNMLLLFPKVTDEEAKRNEEIYVAKCNNKKKNSK